MDKILPFLTPLPPLRGQFLYPECEQKQTVFDPLPPHLVQVVIEWPLIRKELKEWSSKRCNVYTQEHIVHINDDISIHIIYTKYV